MKDDILQGFKHICDITTLQENLTAIALFIGLYENMIDLLKERVESFLSDGAAFDSEGNIRYKHTDTYRKAIKQRIVDEKGNKNELKAVMLWFVDVGAISMQEYEQFLKFKDFRNSYAHNMTQHLWDGLSQTDVELLISLYNFYTKIDKWWINEIEIPTSCYETARKQEIENVESGSHMIFAMIFQTLYGDKSNEYLDIISELQTKLKEERK